MSGDPLMGEGADVLACYSWDFSSSGSAYKG